MDYCPYIKYIVYLINITLKTTTEIGNDHQQ